MTTNTTAVPPAAAVAKDAHWSAKMARLRARKLPERTMSICDDQAAKAAVTDAALSLAKARAAALAECTEQGIREDQRDAWVASNPQVLAADASLTAAQRTSTACGPSTAAARRVGPLVVRPWL
jgi:hypothetical protein